MVQEKKESIEIDVELIIPEEVLIAGNDFYIDAVIPEKFTPSDFSLIVHSALGSNVFFTNSNGQELRFAIPASHTHLAGRRSIDLLYKTQSIGKGQLNIHPKKAINKVDSYTGPKTLFVDDNDGAMIVSIPHDEYGNTLDDDSKVSYTSTFNNKNSTTETQDIDHLITYKKTSAGKEKGKHLVGTQSEQAYSSEQEIIIESIMPARFTIEVVSHFPVADGRQFVHIKTKPIKDKYGNLVSDGTTVNFVVRSKDGLHNLYQSFAVSGIANVYIENPSLATQWEVLASLYGSVESNIVVLDFKKYVNDFTVHRTATPSTYQLGPVFGNLEQLVPDGTPVTVNAKNKVFSKTIFLEKGEATFKIPFHWNLTKSDSLEFIIGGISKSIAVYE